MTDEGYDDLLMQLLEGEFVTTLKVENLEGKEIYFILLGDNGQTKSKAFGLLPQEVL